jgi:hypothetical protein
LAYKAEKQRDLDEVRLLEWRLLTQVSELQARIKEIDQTRDQYETLPMWKRLAMQTIGKNIETLAEYRAIYERSVQDLLCQLEVAQRRIEELKPEATIPKDLRPEYQELKDDITRLGGSKKIREMLAAEEGTNRQAFIQNKRVVLTTAARVLIDPLFAKVRFDVLIADRRDDADLGCHRLAGQPDYQVHERLDGQQGMGTWPRSGTCRPGRRPTPARVCSTCSKRSSTIGLRVQRGDREWLS